MKKYKFSNVNIQVRVRRMGSDDGHPVFRAEVIGCPMHRRHGRTAREAVDALKAALSEAVPVVIAVQQPKGEVAK